MSEQCNLFFCLVFLALLVTCICHSSSIHSSSKRRTSNSSVQRLESSSISQEKCTSSSKPTNTGAAVVVSSSESCRVTSLFLIISCLEHEALFLKGVTKISLVFAELLAICLVCLLRSYLCLIRIRELIRLVNTPKPLC